VLLVAAGIAIAVLSGGSSANKTAAGSSATTTQAGTSHKGGKSTKAHAKAPAPTSNPAETTVAVLNGTTTTGLAHRVASDLQRGGYSQATALSGTPQGANSVTVVEYASGHQSDAQAVAHSLSVTQVQPIESAVAALAGSASVVVVVGADRATGAGAGEESSGATTAVP